MPKAIFPEQMHMRFAKGTLGKVLRIATDLKTTPTAVVRDFVSEGIRAYEIKKERSW